MEKNGVDIESIPKADSKPLMILFVTLAENPVGLDGLCEDIVT